MTADPSDPLPLRAGVARTEAEKEACFALRYRVYVEEFGCDVPTADRARGLDRTADDDGATQIQVSRGSEVVATLRIHHGATSEIPMVFRESCDLLRFLADTPIERMMSIGRLAIDPRERGGTAIVPLFQECFRFARQSHPDTGLIFILAMEEPRLLALYRLLGFRPVDPARRVRVDVGVCLPMVMRLGGR